MFSTLFGIFELKDATSRNAAQYSVDLFSSGRLLFGSSCHRRPLARPQSGKTDQHRSRLGLTQGSASGGYAGGGQCADFRGHDALSRATRAGGFASGPGHSGGPDRRRPMRRERRRRTECLAHRIPGRFWAPGSMDPRRRGLSAPGRRDHRSADPQCDRVADGIRGCPCARSQLPGLARLGGDPEQLCGIPAYRLFEITLAPKRWHLSLAVRFEARAGNQTEWQTRVRLMWTPSERDSPWASVGGELDNLSLGRGPCCPDLDTST